MNLSEFTASDYAAWWGAIIATLAFIWNIVRALFEGPRLRISVSPNMMLFPQNGPTAGKTYIRLIATNTGDAPVTVTNYCGYYAKSRIEIFQKKQQHFVVNVTRELSSPIPHVLQPGTQWTGMLDQDGFYEGTIPPKYLYVGLAHSHSRKVKYKRVKLDA
tara:strand:- start:167 stop:646 length:480 start_codon:yes stop_codon:yes gene_type:complete